MKYGVQIRHQQAGGHPFARNIAQNKIQIAVVHNENAIIAAHDADRLVRKIDFPKLVRKWTLRQQSALDLGGKLQIVLEQPLLFIRKLVKTDSRERISE